MTRPSLIAALIVTLASAAFAQPSECIVMIGHGHIDPVWRWTKDEGREAVFATFRSALDRMNEFDDFKFTASSAQFYQWVADDEPQMFREIQQRVAEGRWEIVGGWWIEPDINTPAGESLVRQGLYGQQFFQQHFGRRATIGFNPDGFGHPATLPQIIRKQGMDSYYFMRPSPTEMPQLAAPVFHWQTPDGSSVLAVQIQRSYGGEESKIDSRIEECRQRYGETLPGVTTYPYFYGVGDHGGGPTIKTIEAIIDDRADKYPGMDFGTARQYVDLMHDVNDTLPTHVGELQHHARGCYVACSAIKRGNRESEHALLTTEKLASIALVYAGTPYPHDDLTAAWHKVLFNQFHDILAGSSIEAAYVDAAQDYGRVASVCDDIINHSTHAITSRVQTADPAYEQSIPFVVFNPSSLPLQDAVAFETERFPKLSKAKVVLRDGQGAPVPLQEVRTAAVNIQGRISFVFNADVPAMGYRLYRLDFTEQTEPATPTALVTATENTLENDLVRVTFDPQTGHMTSCFDKQHQRELLASPAAAPLVLNDPGDTWGHHIDRYDELLSRFSDAELVVLESGPIRATLAIKSRFEDSLVTQVFSLTNDSPVVSCELTVDWRQQQQMLKLAFPTVFADGTLTAGIPYGSIERAMNGEEEPAQNWIDITGPDGAGGLALINDNLGGYSAEHGELRLSVLRSSPWSQHAPAKIEPNDGYRFMDQGVTTFHYWLMPHDGDHRQAHVPARASSLLMRPIVRVTSNHAGQLPDVAGLVASSTPDVDIAAVKQSERGDALVVRLVELNGRDAEARLDLPSLQRQIDLQFQPGEIKTLLVPLDPDATIHETNLLEEPTE